MPTLTITSSRAARLTQRASLPAAGAALAVSLLLAMAYFATADGAKSYEPATVQAWAGPARRLAGGLLTFAGPDRVYATYGLLMSVLLVPMLLAALVVRANRPSSITKFERRAWPVV